MKKRQDHIEDADGRALYTTLSWTRIEKHRDILSAMASATSKLMKTDFFRSAPWTMMIIMKPLLMIPVTPIATLPMV